MSRAFEITREVDLPAAPDDVWTAITAAPAAWQFPTGMEIPEGGGPPPGGYGAPPRPGGFSPRPGEGPAPRGTKNFGPDAPPKHKRKPHMNRREQGPKPIKERPVSRLYENDEDWRAKDDDPLDLDNIATHKDADDVEVDVDDGADKDE